MFFVCFECGLLIELMYHVFAHIPGESYEGRFSSLLCLCGVFWVLINWLSFFFSFLSPPFLKFHLCKTNKRFAIIITCVDYAQIQFCDTVSPRDCCFSTKWNWGPAEVPCRHGGIGAGRQVPTDHCHGNITGQLCPFLFCRLQKHFGSLTGWFLQFNLINLWDQISYLTSMGTAFETEKKRFLGKFCLTDSGKLCVGVMYKRERERW